MDRERMLARDDRERMLARMNITGRRTTMLRSFSSQSLAAF